MRNTSELENFAKKILRKFWYWNHEKAKKVSVLGWKKLSYKIKNVYSYWESFSGNAMGEENENLKRKKQ